MKGISSNTLKLDGNMSYENSQKIKELTAGFNKGDRLKVDRITTMALKEGKFEETTTIIFKKNNNQLLEKITHSFEKLKNKIVENKTKFKKPDLIDNIFKQPSISVRKLNLHTSKMMKEISSADLKKEVAAHNELITENNPISTGKKLPQEEINKMLDDYEKYKAENNKEETQQNNTNRQNTEVDKMWKIIKDDIGL